MTQFDPLVARPYKLWRPDVPISHYLNCVTVQRGHIGVLGGVAKILYVNHVAYITNEY